jgi:CubicO group peptidase (beta-lactamase class C family)
MINILFLLGLFVCLRFSELLPSQKVDSSFHIQQKVNEIFSKLISADTPGAAIAIVKENKLVFKSGYGSANLEYNVPINPSTIFCAGSVSKQFTGMAVAMLVIQGKLSLDDDIRTFLPQVPDFGYKVTIKHLLLHSSGIPDYFGLLAISGVRMDDVVSNQDVLKMVTRLRKLNFKPGTQQMYSNTGYVLAAEIVAKVAGQPFTSWTQNNIFKPLGMNHTCFIEHYQNVLKSRAYSYRGSSKQGFQKMGGSSSVVGPGGLYTTAEDLVKWIGNFDHYRVGGKEAVKLLLTTGNLSDGRQLNYGLGIFVEVHRGLKRIGHGGGSAGFRSHITYFPQHKLGIALWGNWVSFDETKVIGQVIGLCLEDHLAPEMESTPSEVFKTMELDPKVFDEYKGDYQLSDGSIITFGRYYSRYFATVLGEKYKEIFPASESKFFTRDKKLQITFLKKLGRATNSLKVLHDNITKQGQRVVQPSAEALLPYTGKYYCEELSTVWEVVWKEGRLQVEHVRKPDIPPLTFLKDDLFSAGYIFRFKRNKHRKITGFSLSSSRIKNLIFKMINK